MAPSPPRVTPAPSSSTGRAALLGWSMEAPAPSTGPTLPTSRPSRTLTRRSRSTSPIPPSMTLLPRWLTKLFKMHPAQWIFISSTLVTVSLPPSPLFPGSLPPPT
ncbi:hypothetical protein C8R42DRAFT_724839 [Lentinula raphanica]|nr:hypothetical protein C8R42DRAFT_724839 [Lentinula raphanica]